MAGTALTQTITGSTDVNQLQTAVNQQFSSISNIPVVGGAQLSGVSLTTGQTNQIAHKLGRQARGYMVTNISTGALIWNDAFDSKFLPLHCSANCTVDIWVY